ncbi:unnamed protein product, partial [Linum tenue]
TGLFGLVTTNQSSRSHVKVSNEIPCSWKWYGEIIEQGGKWSSRAKIWSGPSMVQLVCGLVKLGLEWWACPVSWESFWPVDVRKELGDGKSIERFFLSFWKWLRRQEDGGDGKLRAK